MGTIFNRQQLNGRRKSLRLSPSQAEILFWHQVRGRQICGYKFRRQHSIGPFIVDFFCSAKKLVVEIDGDSHFENSTIVSYDAVRTAYLSSLGMVVVRFTNQDIYNNLYEVLEKLQIILDALSFSPTDHP